MVNASKSCSAPRSAATDVIRAASIPQGTTQSKGWRSLLTLIARPWVVIPRLTWMPIEPILRASRRSGGERRIGGGHHVSLRTRRADRDRRSPGRPDTGQPTENLSGDVVLAERRDHHPLEQLDPGADVGRAALAEGGQVDDRVGDELAGAVIGDPAAAIGIGDLDSLHPVPVLTHPELAGIGAPALGQHRRVLEEQQGVRHVTVVAGGGEAQLQGGRLVVGDQPEPGRPERFAVHGLSRR